MTHLYVKVPQARSNKFILGTIQSLPVKYVISSCKVLFGPASRQRKGNYQFLGWSSQGLHCRSRYDRPGAGTWALPDSLQGQVESEWQGGGSADPPLQASIFSFWPYKRQKILSLTPYGNPKIPLWSAPGKISVDALEDTSRTSVDFQKWCPIIFFLKFCLWLSGGRV